MYTQRRFPLSAISQPGLRPFVLLGLLLALWAAALVWLLAQPVLDLNGAIGLFPREIGREQRSFRWTGSQVTIPLRSYGAATRLDLVLAAEPWPDRLPTVVTVGGDNGEPARFVVPAPRRRYKLLLHGAAHSVQLTSTLDRPPGRERRWVGVQLFAAAASPLGLPWRAVAYSAFAPLVAGAVLFVVQRLWGRGKEGEMGRQGEGETGRSGDRETRRPKAGAGNFGYRLSAIPSPSLRAIGYRLSVIGYRLSAIVYALVGLALVLRLYRLASLPTGVHHDELVSLVDAWYLLHSGRDHHGALLPLGAFEAFGDWISPLLTYLELPLVALLGPTALAGRLLTATLGALGVLLLYRLCRTIALPRAAALVGAALVALSPWQISLSRTAIPPALVFVAVTLCLLAGLRLIERGSGRAALGLALSAGLGLYAYPTLKMFLPMLVALTVAIALKRHGLRAARAWLGAAGLLVLLWSPFVWQTLFNAESATRFGDLAIRADTPGAWLWRWANNYAAFFRPEFYYLYGDRLVDHGYLKAGLQPWAELPLVVAGLGALAWRVLWSGGDRERGRQGAGETGSGAVAAQDVAPSRGETERQVKEGRHSSFSPQPSALSPDRSSLVLLCGALLLAPLPASLTWQQYHAYRATTVAPFYALLATLGAAALWQFVERLRPSALRRTLRWGGLVAIVLAELIQVGGWYQGYLRDYPAQSARPWVFQDGLLETLRVTARYAADYDEIRFDSYAGNIPYIYLLAALPAPLANPAHELDVMRGYDPYNEVRAVGRYRFVSFDDQSYDLPTREVIFNQLNQPTYLVQELDEDGRRILLIRLYSSE